MDDPVRFYLDEHIDPAIAKGLRRLGIDVVTTQDVGNTGNADHEQIAFAMLHQRVIVTCDQDYGIWHNQGNAHSGILLFHSSRETIGTYIRGCELLHGVYSADDMINHLEHL